MIHKIAEYFYKLPWRKMNAGVLYQGDYMTICVPILIENEKIVECSNDFDLDACIKEAKISRRGHFYKMTFVVNGELMTEYEFAHYASGKQGYTEYAIRVAEIWFKNRSDDLLTDCFSPVSFNLLFAPFCKEESDELAKKSDLARLAVQIIKMSKYADWGHIGTAKRHILGDELRFVKIDQELKDSYYFDLTRFGNRWYFDKIRSETWAHKWGQQWLKTIRSHGCKRCTLFEGSDFYDKYKDFMGCTKDEWSEMIARMYTDSDVDCGCENDGDE